MEINGIKAANIKTLALDPDKKVKKIPDGGGLYLFIYPTVKRWYRLAKKDTSMYSRIKQRQAS